MHQNLRMRLFFTLSLKCGCLGRPARSSDSHCVSWRPRSRELWVKTLLRVARLLFNAAKKTRRKVPLCGQFCFCTTVLSACSEESSRGTKKKKPRSLLKLYPFFVPAAQTCIYFYKQSDFSSINVSYVASRDLSVTTSIKYKTLQDK